MPRGNDLARIPKKSLSTQTRDYVYIQEVIPASTTRGDFDDTWQSLPEGAPIQHAAAILSMTAKQKLEYRSVNVEATHIIKIRGEIEVSEINRVLFGSRIFEILTVEDIQERGIVKWISCKERRS